MNRLKTTTLKILGFCIKCLIFLIKCIAIVIVITFMLVFFLLMPNTYVGLLCLTSNLVFIINLVSKAKKADLVELFRFVFNNMKYFVNLWIINIIVFSCLLHISSYYIDIYDDKTSYFFTLLLMIYIRITTIPLNAIVMVPASIVFNSIYKPSFNGSYTNTVNDKN